MEPASRLDYRASIDRPGPILPDGKRVAVFLVVSFERWDIARPMPRQVLTPPQGYGIHTFDLRISWDVDSMPPSRTSGDQDGTSWRTGLFRGRAPRGGGHGADRSRHGRGSLVMRTLGGTRAGELAFHRFLASPSVTHPAMPQTLGKRSLAAAAGRRIVVAQDTAEIDFSGRQANRRGLGPAGRRGVRRIFHPPAGRHR